MDKTIPGIHHITAIAGDPQVNVNFYAGVLGLRLVKITVNFDDPGAYHLYYGDGLGRPGSVMTFFAWPGARHGRPGTGQVTTTSFSVPQGSLGFWKERLAAHDVAAVAPPPRFDEEAILFSDPDGLDLELVASPQADTRPPWAEGPVPAEHAIRGFYSATLSEEGYERTAQLLTETMGFRPVAEEGNRFRYAAGAGGPGAIVDLLCRPEERSGEVAVGTVHHIAWRTPTDEQQSEWRWTIAGLGYNVTPILDRQYFHSIYYREPGGILFEIATDAPGFTADETPESLGTSLKLPPWLEPSRPVIEQRLAPLQLPAPFRPAGA